MKFLLHIVIALLLSAAPLRAQNNVGLGKRYLSPTHMCANRAQGLVYISLSTANKIAVLDAKTRQLEKYIDLPFNPGGIAFCKHSNTLIIADKKPNGQIHFLSLENERISQSIAVGHTPDAIVISPDEKQIFAANRFSNTVSVIDVKKLMVVKTIPVERDPKAIAISGDGNVVAVANSLPLAEGNESYISAKISLIDRGSLKIVSNIKLANGSQSIEGLAFSKDGKYLYASHILSRNHLPTTQLKNGWMNNNALSIVDIEKKEYYATVLLDSYNRGAANPRGMDISDDGKFLYVALAGAHELCIIMLPELIEKLADAKSNALNNKLDNRFENIQEDSRFLNGLKKRVPIKGTSPRHVIAMDGDVLVSSYFSVGLDCLINPEKSAGHEIIVLGSQPEMTIERKGELLFHDANLCFQQWQSCATCHPDGRTDGLNWDLLNDGIGNPKNSKSLLKAHVTPPAMITGIRENAAVAVRSGIKYILFSGYQEGEAQAIDAYLSHLKPVPSPYLQDGKLSYNAKKGKQVFEKAGCITCHSGNYFTNGKSYDVDTGFKPHQNEKFDTPTLIEVWRTAPYLYDGRAKTIEEVFTKFNTTNTHGTTNNLTQAELNNLAEYVLSL